MVARRGGGGGEKRRNARELCDGGAGRPNLDLVPLIQTCETLHAKLARLVRRLSQCREFHGVFWGPIARDNAARSGGATFLRAPPPPPAALFLLRLRHIAMQCGLAFFVQCDATFVQWMLNFLAVGSTHRKKKKLIVNRRLSSPPQSARCSVRWTRAAARHAHSSSGAPFCTAAPVALGRELAALTSFSKF